MSCIWPNDGTEQDEYGRGVSEQTPLLHENAQYGGTGGPGQSPHQRDAERAEQARREAALKEIVWFTGENLIDTSTVVPAPQLVDRSQPLLTTAEVKTLLQKAVPDGVLPRPAPGGTQLNDDERAWLADVASGISDVLAKYPHIEAPGALVQQFG